MKYLKITFFLFFIHLGGMVFAQDKGFFNKQLEDTLNYWGNMILSDAEDFVKYNAQEHFNEILMAAVGKENSIEYPFDSLKTAFRYTSPDKKLRFFNWALPKKDGTYEYYCIMQSYNKNEKRFDIYQLKDKSDEITIPENAMLGPEKWFGVLYYQVIPEEYKDKKYYTLLGWDGNNKISRKKIIDVLTISDNGKPGFGAPIFKCESKMLKRVIFEYNSSAIFTLRYDNQFIEKGKKKKWVIVCDRLIPMQSNQKGYYQFYVPDKSIIDAFYFTKGKWIQIKNIDVRSKHHHFIQKRTEF
jgi:hypothetical protein